MERQAITVRGVVQGVGFRPFVYGLASRLQLSGFVRNRTGALHIEVEGERPSLARFLRELRTHSPPLARIDGVQRRRLPLRGEAGFRIEPSERDLPSDVFISPDVATCADCLAELFDPADRRYRYPFLNCTQCGPRLTIIQAAPYDRERTTMAAFPMCPACRAEYEDPADRRFHAQPTACPACGPQLEALTAAGEPIVTADPLAAFAAVILGGGIGALKGLGGFHLVCDARDANAVNELRRRKHRDEKPFAIMARDVESVRQWCEVDRRERELLQSPRSPVVLLRRRRAGPTPDTVADAVAPGNPYLGVMLPCTPLHHLLLQAVDGIPLVMTSGNRSDEPTAYDDRDALLRLGDIADVFLTHNRRIQVRCDDSVTRIVAGEELPVRRSRGYAPEPIELPAECPRPMLAVGGQFKGVFALGRSRHAFLSHHLGDLDDFAASRDFQRDVRLYEDLFDIRPQAIVHDLHPEYASTDYARRRAAEEGVELIAVQHHHAHLASCLAEHGLDEPVIGVTFDGTGLGTDGAIWGGEFLVGDTLRFTRMTHLRYVRMPGGDRAVREPWRMAVAHLLDAGCDPAGVRGAWRKLPASDPSTEAGSFRHETLEQMIERGFHAPWTSSMGRLFDAVAAIAGVRTHAGFEAQAAMELEWLATGVQRDGAYPFELRPDVVDTRPLIRAVVQDVQRQTSEAVVARRFHSTVVEIIAAVCARIRSETKLDAVALSGGVFMNALLQSEASTRLAAEGFRVYRHRRVPPGDGGLCLGQLAIGAAVLTEL